MDAKPGYRFANDVTVTVNGKPADEIFWGADDYIDIGVIVTPVEEVVEYNIISGENQTYTKKQSPALVVKADGQVSKSVGFRVDDETISESNYAVASGSTIVTLKTEFLDTLAEGVHKLTFVYIDGEVSTNFTVIGASQTITEDDVANAGETTATEGNANESQSATGEDDTNDSKKESFKEKKKANSSDRKENNTTSGSPKTGDNIIFWISLMFISGLVFFGTYKYIRKRK